MKNLFTKLREQVEKFFSGMSKGQRGRLFALLGGVVVLAVVLAVALNQTNYGVLYSGLDSAEAGEVLAELESMGVDAKTQNGDTILVPEEQISELRMQLAYAGFSTGGLSLDIFEEASGLGMTDMEKQVYLNAQMQSDLRTIINSMDKIEDCYVYLNMNQDTSFVLSSVTANDSASVVIELAGGSTLTSAEAKAIAETVASGTGIDVANVSVMDTRMNIYSTSGEADGVGGSGTVQAQLELENYVSSQLQNQVESLLAPVFGSDGLRVVVNAKLNFDKETTSSITFEPVTQEDTGLIVSMYEQYESSRTGDAAGGAVGTDSNLYGTDGYVYQGLDEDELYNSYIREVNYELNEIQQVVESAQGTIEDLTVAVLLDQDAVAGDYARSVRNLVGQALGIEADAIAVENLPFQESSDTLTDAISAQQDALRIAQRNELVRTIVTALLALAVVIAVIFIARMVVKSVSRRPRLAAADGPAIDYTAGDELEGEQAQQPVSSPNEAAEEMEINMKSSPVTRLERMVEQDPEAVAQLLRNWLWDD